MSNPPNQNYETLYGVGLLDDLHNYFPALLYDSSGFGSVQDVLQYVQQQTRARFDLFSYGQREYQSTNIPRLPSVNTHQRFVRTYSTVPSSTRAVNSTLPTAVSTAQERFYNPTIFNVNVPLGDLDTEEDEEEEDNGDTQPGLGAAGGPEVALTNLLLQLLPGTLTRNYVNPHLNDGGLTMEQILRGRPNMTQFLQPIVVRPSAEQIAQNTTVGNLVSDTEHTCAICQDTLTSDQEGRKLNHCGHWFHRGCIDTWLQGNVHCPVCRHDIREATSAPSSSVSAPS